MIDKGSHAVVPITRRVAVLWNGSDLHAWQAAALKTLGDDVELYYLIADNVPAPRRQLIRHFAYYALNAVSIRRAAGAPVPFVAPPDMTKRTLRFSPEWDGAWAKFTPDALTWLAENRIDAVVKFTLSLLRIPEQAPPIISFHHGDPAEYRGRPAGFYEIGDRAPFLGQIVQRLNNSVDAGEILALAHTRVHPHSYRRTLADAYAISPHLLRPALVRLFADERLDHPTSGRNFRLPRNGRVLAFLGSMVASAIRRLWYGAVYEKRWNVSVVPVTDNDRVLPDATQMERLAESSALATPPHFSFLADPFFHDDATILVEALDKRSGKGRLAAGRDGSIMPLAIEQSVHFSYPATVRESGTDYVVPEMAGARRTGIFRLAENRLDQVADLCVAEGAIIDPTFVRHQGQLYLFGNLPGECPNVLRLWQAQSLFTDFKQHPSSPIRISVRGGRMGGRIIETAGGLIRPGQDFERSYGDALLLFRIVELSPEIYREEQVGRIAFTNLRGPHTLDLRGNQIVFDWYRDRFSPMAGIRRVLAKL